MPTRYLKATTRSGYPLKLVIRAESDYLAVGQNAPHRYFIYHKPTSLRVSDAYTSLAAAKRDMKKIANLEWDFGHNWSLAYKASRRRPTGAWKRTRDALRAMGWFKLKQEVEG